MSSLDENNESEYNAGSLVTTSEVDDLTGRLFNVIWDANPGFNLLMNSLTHILTGVVLTYADDQVEAETLLDAVNVMAKSIVQRKLNEDA